MKFILRDKWLINLENVTDICKSNEIRKKSKSYDITVYYNYPANPEYGNPNCCSLCFDTEAERDAAFDKIVTLVNPLKL